MSVVNSFILGNISNKNKRKISLRRGLLYVSRSKHIADMNTVVRNVASAEVIRRKFWRQYFTCHIAV